MSLLNSGLRAVGWPLRVGTSRLTHGDHIVRYYMYETLSKAVSEPAQGLGKKVLSISFSGKLVDLMGLGKAEIVEANYPEHSAVDLSAFSSGSFDYVVSDQVLEHIEGDPQSVFDESLRLLRPGGIAVHTTVFMFPIHAYPSDFWRFSPQCLKMLARKFSNVIEVGGFGNRALWVVDILGAHVCPVPHAKWHPLHIIATHNSPNWPVVTWVVARK